MILITSFLIILRAPRCIIFNKICKRCVAFDENGIYRAYTNFGKRILSYIDKLLNINTYNINVTTTKRQF